MNKWVIELDVEENLELMKSAPASSTGETEVLEVVSENQDSVSAFLVSTKARPISTAKL